MTITSPYFGPLSDESEGLCTDPTTDIDLWVDDARGADPGISGRGQSPAGASAAAVKQAKLYPMRLIDFIHRYAQRYMPPGRLRVHLAGTGGTDPWIAPTSRQTYSRDQLIAGGDIGLRNPQVYRGPMMIRATLATGASHGVALDAAPPAALIDETGGGAALGQRLKLLFTAAAPAWTAQDMGPSAKNCFLRVSRTVGGVTEKRWPEIPIADNGADFIILDLGTTQAAALFADLLATDAVEIVWPSVLIQGATNWGGGVKALQIIGRGTTQPALAALAFGDQGHTFERIAFGDVFAKGDGLSFDRCQFIGAVLGTLLAGDGDLLVNCSCGNVQKVGRSISPLLTPSSRPDSATDPALPAPYVQAMVRQLEVGNAESAIGHFCASGVLSAYRSAADGIRVTGSGSSFWQNASGGAPCDYLGGDNNTGVGVAVSYGGRAMIRGISGGAAPDLTTVKGGAGDLQLSSGGAVAYGIGAKAFEEVIGYAGNLHGMGGSTAAVPVGDFAQILKV